MFKSLYISIYHLRALKFSKPKPAILIKPWVQVLLVKSTLDTTCGRLKTKGQQKPKNSVLHSLPSEQNHTYKTNKYSLQYTDGLVHTYMHTKNCVVS